MNKEPICCPLDTYVFSQTNSQKLTCTSILDVLNGSAKTKKRAKSWQLRDMPALFSRAASYRSSMVHYKRLNSDGLL